MKCIHCCLLLSFCVTGKSAEKVVTLKTAEDPGANKLNEPRAKAYSLDKAIHFLDSASLNWQKKRKCFTCHTNYAFLYARPLISSEAPAHQAVRSFAEELVQTRWPKRGPRWDAEVVATAAALAFNDAATTNRLHPLTRKALDRMWTVQRKNGSWNWLKCDWPPMESDDHYGVTLAAIAAGVAPEDYAKTDAAKKGLQSIRNYLKKNPPPTLHHSAMWLWASSYLPDLLTDTQKQAVIDKLLKLQKQDGGWALATLGDWKRVDGSPQDVKSSDGYATGFVIYVLRKAGLSADDKRLQRGIQWLKANQRQSGRWITRSLHSDSRHYISHAGTAFALMALKECDALR